MASFSKQRRTTVAKRSIATLSQKHIALSKTMKTSSTASASTTPASTAENQSSGVQVSDVQVSDCNNHHQNVDLLTVQLQHDSDASDDAFEKQFTEETQLDDDEDDDEDDIEDDICPARKKRRTAEISSSSGQNSVRQNSRSRIKMTLASVLSHRVLTDTNMIRANLFQIMAKTFFMCENAADPPFYELLRCNAFLPQQNPHLSSRSTLTHQLVHGLTRTLLVAKATLWELHGL